MATLQVSEYASIQSTMQGDIVHIPQTPPLAVQTVTYTAGTSSASGIFNSNTRFVRVATDASVDANIAFGKAGVSAGDVHDRLPADSFGFWGINPDEVDRLAVS